MGEAEKPDADVPLAFATQEQLMGEIRRRFAVFLFVGRPNDTRKCDWVRSWYGAIDRVIGLMEIAKHDLLKPTLDDIV